MATTNRPDIMDCDPAELSDYLLDAGFTGIRTERSGGWLNVLADQPDPDVEAAVASFVPKSSGFDPTTGLGTYAGRLSANLKTHVPHVKAFFEAQRDGTQAAKTQATRLAEAEHVIADLALILRELVRSDLL